MALRLAAWPGRRVRAIWGAGVALEAALLLAMSMVLTRPEPPRVGALRGNGASRGVIAFRLDTLSVDTLRIDAAHPQGPNALEDSFYTVVRWPPGRPLQAGGGRVVGLPMRLWWVPVLYVAGVPLALIGVTGAWGWARRRARRRGPG